MVSWLRALLPAVPVILDVAREVRRQREPAPAPGNGDLEAALARATEALARVSADLEQVTARQAAIERRLDVIGIAMWTFGGVLAITVIGLLVYLVRA